MSTAIIPAGRRCLLVAVLASIVSASVVLDGEAWAQDAPAPATAVVVGAKVRVSAPSAIRGPIQGTVMEMDDQSLLLNMGEKRPLRVPREAVTQLEVSTGRHGHALAGSIIGAAFGVAFTASFPADAFCTPDQSLANDPSCLTRGQVIAIGVLSYGAFGALIGHLIKSESWTAVSPGHINLTVAPTDRRGARVAIAATW